MTALRRLLATALLLLIAPSVVHACTCAFPGNGCGGGPLPSEEVVFLGKVTDKVDLATPDDAGIRDLSSGYAVHFSVSESFHGVSDPDAELVVNTGSGGGDCGYPFVVGSSYLVFASSYKGRLSTGICSGTKPENRVGGLLKQLRAIRDTGHGFDLFGTIVKLDTGAAFSSDIKAEPLTNISVRVIGSHGTLFSTTTDDRGGYTLAWLPPDTYRVEQDLPAGLSIPGRPPEPLKFGPSDKQAPGFACRFDIYANPDGRISGIVVDLSGKEVDGAVNLERIDVKQATANGQRVIIASCDTENGKFLFEQVAPGRYKLTFWPKTARSEGLPRKFYGFARSEASVGTIELGLGQHIENIRFEIPLSGPEP